MTFAGLLNQPLTLEHRALTGRDAYGNEVVGTVDSTAVEGYVEQTAATEITVDRETYTTDWLVILPADTVVDGLARVRYSAHVLEVIGAPLRAWNPRGRAVHHIEARCREVTG